MADNGQSGDNHGDNGNHNGQNNGNNGGTNNGNHNGQNNGNGGGHNSIINYNEWFSSFSISGYLAEKPTMADNMYVVPVSASGNDEHYTRWDAQFCNVLHKIKGQEEGNSFELTFDVKWGSANGYDAATMYFMTGKMIRNVEGEPDFQQYQYSEENTELIINSPTSITYGIPYNVNNNEWKTITITGTIGEKGAENIGIEFDLAGESDQRNTGIFYFKNIVLNIGGNVIDFGISGNGNNGGTNNGNHNGQNNGTNNVDGNNSGHIAFNEWFLSFERSNYIAEKPSIIDSMYVVHIDESMENRWSAQFCNVLQGLKGQRNGRTIDLTFDVKWESKLDVDSATIYLATGKLIKNNENEFGWQDYYITDNTEIVDAANVSLNNTAYKMANNEWTTLNIKGVITEKGAESIGIQFDLVGWSPKNIGTFYFKNIVLSIDGNVTNYTIGNNGGTNNGNHNGQNNNGGTNNGGTNNGNGSDNNGETKPQPTTPEGITAQNFMDVINQVINFVTDVDEQEANEVTIYSYNNKIVVELAEGINNDVEVFDVNGRMVVKVTANSNRIEIPMRAQGVFIVRVGGVAKRVVVY